MAGDAETYTKRSNTPFVAVAHPLSVAASIAAVIYPAAIAGSDTSPASDAIIRQSA